MNVWIALSVYRQISTNFIHVHIYLIFTFLRPQMILAFGHVFLYTKMNMCAVTPWAHIPRLTWAPSVKLRQHSQPITSRSRRSANIIVPGNSGNDDRDGGTYSCPTHLELHAAGAVTALVLEALVALVLQHRVAGVGAREGAVVAALDVLGRGTPVQDVELSGEDGCVGRCQSDEEEEDGLGAEEHVCLICSWTELVGVGLVR